MPDLWYPTNDGDRLWRLHVSMSAEGLRSMQTLCGREAIALGEGVLVRKIPDGGMCMACFMRHGDQLADRREQEQPARVVALAQQFITGLDAVLEAVEVADQERRQIEGPR